MDKGIAEDPEVSVKVEEWLAWDRNETTRREINELVEKNDAKQLRSRLCSRMAFGTAGLRAEMGAGYSMMNDLTVIQTTQGFSEYILEICPNIKQRGAVIGYDARHNSLRFAELAAAVMVSKEIPVYLFGQICPTPFVPYAVTKLGCDWGIMVTASHNPKQDNGYKVYYSNGAQIIPPHDKNISEKIKANLEPLVSSWDTDILNTSPLKKDLFSLIFSSYMEDLKLLCHYREKNQATPLKFTYTAMHGVGYQFIQEAFKVFNFKPCIPVKEQVQPDPDFPTVKFPNPEEGKSALDLSMKTANQNDSTIIVANDPDADRFAFAEKQPNGKWHVFSGNELGALIGWWIWTNYKTAHPNATRSDVYCLASTVSSKVLRSIAVKEGYVFCETLTGFKWMGNKACDLIKEGKTVLFAFEEAIGFMCGTTVLDKDGISACVVMAEMASYLHEQGVSIKQQLAWIWDTYGYHLSSNSYYICHDPQKIAAMFDHLRNYEGPGKYPSSCGPYKIKNIRDLTTGFDSSQPDKKAVLPVSKSSQMITFSFENGSEATMRTSGTEPKIKYYTEYIADPEKGLTREMVTQELNTLVECLVKYFFEPDKNNLIARQS